MRSLKYKELIPHIVTYGEKFEELDLTDFRIVESMCRLGVRNTRKVAHSIGLSQQVMSYRVRRFEENDLVRFRAVIDEAKLGLKNYVVIANVSPAELETGSNAMTCFPLWRYLALVDGWKHGNYVRYLIPPDREKDLEAFLCELTTKALILDYEIFPTTNPAYPFPNLGFYAKSKKTPVFNWSKWVNDLDTYERERLEEPALYGNAIFDLYDLLILRSLQINARMRFRNIAVEIARTVGEHNYRRFISLVSRRFARHIIAQQLIRGYRAYVFPSLSSSVLFLIFRFRFRNASVMQKFISGLRNLPYITVYQKVLADYVLFIHFVIPIYEYSTMNKAFVKLAENGIIRESHLLLGDMVRGSWDNVELHQMYKNGRWSFNYEIALKALEKSLT